MNCPAGGVGLRTSGKAGGSGEERNEIDSLKETSSQKVFWSVMTNALLPSRDQAEERCSDEDVSMTRGAFDRRFDHR